MSELIKQYYRLILHSDCQKYAIAKKEGNELKYPHQKNYLTEDLIKESIEGKLSLGVMLNKDDKTYVCKAGCIDLDIPRDANDLSEGLALAKKLKETALKSNLKAYIEFSGNRGYHVWIFSDKPVLGSVMIKCLELIALQANFTAKEVFPNKYPVESKCIKLPFTTHLKSNNRSGFIDDDFDPNNPLVNLETQLELMQKFELSSSEDVIKCANTQDNKSSKTILSSIEKDNNGEGSGAQRAFGIAQNNDVIVSSKDIETKLNSFGLDHPSCINHLMSKGAPLEIDYHQANLSLIRYCLTRGLSLENSLPLAESMAKNTCESHPTSKDYRGKVENFKSEFKSASRNTDKYNFDCGYILSGIKKGDAHTRGCIGTKCKVHFNYQDKANYYPLPLFIFEAMLNLANEDREICKSNLLREIESKLIPDNQVSNQGSESEKLIESEVLAYLIQESDISECLEVLPQGFITSTDKTLLQYLEYLLSLPLPNEDTISSHIDLIREKGIKSVAKDNFSNYQNSLHNEANSSIEILSKSIDDTESLMKKSLADNNLLCASEKIPEWVNNLFDEDSVSIPTFSHDLNYFLNGGLAKGRLYVIGAPPANGKSTISAQIGDLASSKGFKVGYASYEMSADQLFSCSLSRLGGINSSLIESKKYLKDVKLTEQLIKVIKQYKTQIGDNIHLIEADDLYTPNRLLAIVKKLDLDLLIVDYLQLLSSGDEKLDSSYQETLKVSKIATELKRISRKANIPIIAISDISKDAYTRAMKDGDLDMSALRDSFKIAHSADCIMLLLSEDTSKTVKEDDKKVEKKATQLYVLAEKMREKSMSLGQKIEMLAHEFKLNKETADTYSRLKIAKNRTGKCGDILFRYSKALHYFEPLNYLTDNVNFYEYL